MVFGSGGTGAGRVHDGVAATAGETGSGGMGSAKEGSVGDGSGAGLALPHTELGQGSPVSTSP